jgi:YD repeat-containing protein
VILSSDPFVPGQSLPIQATRTVYDGASRVLTSGMVSGVSVTVAEVDPTVTDPTEALFQITAVSGAGLVNPLDGNNQPIPNAWALDPSFTGWLSKTDTVYNPDGTVASSTVTDYTTGPNGPVVEQTAETDYGYDADGNQTVVKAPAATVWDPNANNGQGGMVTTQPTTSTQYDADGRAVLVTDAEGHKVRIKGHY